MDAISAAAPPVGDASRPEIREPLPAEGVGPEDVTSLSEEALAPEPEDNSDLLAQNYASPGEGTGLEESAQPLEDSAGSDAEPVTEAEPAMGLVAENLAGPRPALLAPAPAGPTVSQRARERYGTLLDQGHRIETVRSDHNGGRPVHVIRPRDLRDGEPYSVHTHYHGDRITAEHRKDGVADAIADRLRSSRTVYVLPEADNQDEGQARYSGRFNQRETTNDALRAVGLEPRLARAKTVSGHSRGGTALKQALDSNTMDADRIKFLDTPSNDGSTPGSYQAWRARGNNARATFHDGVYGSLWRNVPGVEFIPGNRDHMDAVRLGLTR